jgi:hypothetical protein
MNCYYLYVRHQPQVERKTKLLDYWLKERGVTADYVEFEAKNRIYRIPEDQIEKVAVTTMPGKAYLTVEATDYCAQLYDSDVIDKDVATIMTPFVWVSI